MEIRTGYATSGATSPGDLKLYYEDMGDVDDPPVLLIMGLGAQLLLWRTAFCEKLVGRGLRVIRYDNRDVGLSSKTEPPQLERAAGPPDGPLLARAAQRGRVQAGRHGRRRRRSAGSPGHRARPHRRGIDGRHDRPGLRGAISPSGPRRWRSSFPATTDRSCRRPPHVHCWRSLKGPPPGSPREVIVDNVVRVTKITGSPRYRMTEEQVRADAAERLRPQLLPIGCRPAVQRGPGQRQPACLQPANRRTDRGHPRPSRQARRAPSAVARSHAPSTALG